MTDLQWLLDDVAASPEGPQVAAFFDFDGTLIDGYSAKAFFKERLKNRDIGLRELLKTVYESASMERRGSDISRLMDVAIGALAGRSIEDVNAVGEELFKKKISGMIFPGARSLIDAHREKGHTLVIASSATPPQIEPAARDLGVPNILATQFDISDGVLTGRVDGTIKWGPGKADAVARGCSACTASRNINARNNICGHSGSALHRSMSPSSASPQARASTTTTPAAHGAGRQ